MNSSMQPSESFGILCREMHLLLSQFGVIDPLGEGDLDICLDNYNNHDFYVLVKNISVLRQDWVTGIQEILRKVGGNWQVHIRLDIPPSGSRPAFDCAGLEISVSSMKELWNREDLCHTFGEAFRFCDASGR